MTDRVPASHLLGPDLTAIDAFAAHPEQPADLAGRAARALYDDLVWRLAHADLPAGARARVRLIECRAADLVYDFVRRGLPPRYFWADFGAMAHELDGIAAETASAEASATRRVLADLRRTAAAASLPPAVRGRVQVAITALEAGLAVHEAGDLPAPELHALADQAGVAVASAVGALEGLAADPAEARFHRVVAAALRGTPESGHRAAIAARLHDLQAAWELGGDLPAGALDELEALVAAAPAAPLAAARVPSPAPELAGHALRLDQAANRVAAAPLPPFVADAAVAILAHLRGLLADRGAGTIEPAAFDAALARGLETVESCLAFAREAGAERDLAARRTEALARRVAAAPAPPLLAGLLEDELERLRALMRDLDVGTVTLLDFHRAFDEAVEAIERLLGWRDAFQPTTPPEEAPPCAAS